MTGVALEGELRRLVQIATARSFDELPIPFRAIATDIGTGEMVVLKEGSVVQAIRASMSVPGAVAPVEIGTSVNWSTAGWCAICRSTSRARWVPTSSSRSTSARRC